jgi:hypothetical protein
MPSWRAAARQARPGCAARAATDYHYSLGMMSHSAI